MKTNWLLAGMVTIALLCLKLTNQIDWSWWWITFPAWGFLCIDFGLIVLTALWQLDEDKKKRAAELEYRLKYPNQPKSKFMQKLEEAMEASEKARKEKENQKS